MSEADARTAREQSIAAAQGPAEEPAPAAGVEPEVAPEADGDLAAQRDEYLAIAQRTQADFENYKRRASRDVAGARQRGAGDLARELLPALDNLDRAIAAADQDDPLLKGVRLVRDELAAALGRAGIVSYSPLGEPFDPTLHEAVATAPAPGEEVASGTVIDVYQDGYRTGELVIRPARVVVAA